jgi:hypothetical protein
VDEEVVVDGNLITSPDARRSARVLPRTGQGAGEMSRGAAVLRFKALRFAGPSLEPPHVAP